MADENLVDRIKKSLDNLATLEIITAVGPVTRKSENEPLELLDQAKSSVILTRINLLQGDITTVYHEDFVTGRYQELKNFHADREKEGYEIVKKNLEALEDLYNFAKELLKEEGSSHG
jgi:hypothetical protein